MENAVVDDRLVGLRSLCSGPTFVSEGGKEYVLLPKLRFTSDNKVVEMDALLRPGEHTGYPTRLFLSQALPGKGQGGGWSVHTIFGRTWHTWSWRGVPADIPLLQILLGHLWALR